MIYLITGQPGNGKTLFAMAAMHAEYERNMAGVKAGKEEPRQFFSNVKGAVLGEWYHNGEGKPLVTNPDAYPWVQRLPEHNDWTELPDGSYVQYDEAHSDGKTKGLEPYGLLFPATGKPGESEDHRVRSMSTHRQRGFDLVLMTQYPNKIHHQVRTLVGEHMHMNRAMGLEAAGVVKWTRTQVDPYDEKMREKAEEEIWRYPKDQYKRYISATLHTASYKFKIPKKVWSGLSMLVVMGLVAWGLYYVLVPKFARDKKAKPPQAEASLLAPAVADPLEALIAGTKQYDAINTEKAPSLAGIVASERGCRAFATDGVQIDMTEANCRQLLENPLPFNIFHKFEGGGAPGAGPRPAVTASPGAIVTGGQTTGYGDIKIPGAAP